MEIRQETIEELEAKLTKLKQKKALKEKRAKEQYISSRDNNAQILVHKAIILNNQLTEFKKEVEKVMQYQAEELEKYGEMRSNSKGGFSIVNTMDTHKIRRTRDTNPTWDERSQKAVELIKDFLQDSIKKRAEKEFNLIMSFLEKNSAGDLEYQKVMTLLSQESNYDDPRWKEGLKLLRESYKIVLKGYGYNFEFKNPDGKWNTIPLNFSNISTIEKEEFKPL